MTESIGDFLTRLVSYRGLMVNGNLLSRDSEAQLHSMTHLLKSHADLLAENDRLRASLANSGGPCAYCSLPKEDWAKCQQGFPGCPRADDAMLCPHVGSSLDTERELAAWKQATFEVVSTGHELSFPHAITQMSAPLAMAWIAKRVAELMMKVPNG